MPTNVDGAVLAAGGLVTRRGMILLVHRKEKGWELPKGRVEPKESLEEAALREVLEESGYRCEIGMALPTVHYLAESGRKKSVQFWEMTVKGTVNVPPDASIDAILWCSRAEAARKVRHAHERKLLEKYG